MSAPAIVTLADWKDPVTGDPRFYKILNADPVTIKGTSGATAGAGYSGTIDFLVNMVDLLDFATFCGGTHKTIDLGGGVTADRIIPLSHPGVSKLLCNSIDSRGIGEYTPSNPEWCRQHSHAKVKVGFGSVPYATDGSEPFMSHETRAGAEVYTLAGSQLKFSTGENVGADAGITVPTVIHVLTVYLAFSLNDTVLDPLLGSINNATFLGKPAGTIRFDSYTSQETLTADMQRTYTRSIFLTYRPIHWNYFLKPSGVWDLVQKPTTGDPVYALQNLSPLLS